MGIYWLFKIGNLNIPYFLREFTCLWQSCFWKYGSKILQIDGNLLRGELWTIENREIWVLFLTPFEIVWSMLRKYMFRQECHHQVEIWSIIWIRISFWTLFQSILLDSYFSPLKTENFLIWDSFYDGSNSNGMMTLLSKYVVMLDW